MRYAMVIVNALGLARLFLWLGQRSKNPFNLACKQTPKRGTLCTTGIKDSPPTGTETPEVSEEIEMTQNQEGILVGQKERTQQEIQELFAKAERAQQSSDNRPPVGRESATEALTR